MQFFKQGNFYKDETWNEVYRVDKIDHQYEKGVITRSIFLFNWQKDDSGWFKSTVHVQSSETAEGTKLDTEHKFTKVPRPIFWYEPKYGILGSYVFNPLWFGIKRLFTGE